jgi:hypothetical protein
MPDCEARHPERTEAENKMSENQSRDDLRIYLQDHYAGAIDAIELPNHQALEGLLSGITGKQALWRALAADREASPTLQQIDFAHLEKRPMEQAHRVEVQRLETTRAIFRAV